MKPPTSNCWCWRFEFWGCWVLGGAGVSSFELLKAYLFIGGQKKLNTVSHVTETRNDDARLGGCAIWKWHIFEMVVDQDKQLLSFKANFHQESVEICFRFLSPRSCISKVCKWFYCCNNFSAPYSFRSRWYLWNSTSSALFNLKRLPWISEFVCLDSHPFYNVLKTANVSQHFEIGELHTLFSLSCMKGAHIKELDIQARMIPPEIQNQVH